MVYVYNNYLILMLSISATWRIHTNYLSMSLQSGPTQFVITSNMPDTHPHANYFRLSLMLLAPAGYTHYLRYSPARFGLWFIGPAR